MPTYPTNPRKVGRPRESVAEREAKTRAALSHPDVNPLGLPRILLQAARLADYCYRSAREAANRGDRATFFAFQDRHQGWTRALAPFYASRMAAQTGTPSAGAASFAVVVKPMSSAEWQGAFGNVVDVTPQTNTSAVPNPESVSNSNAIANPAAVAPTPPAEPVPRPAPQGEGAPPRAPERGSKPPTGLRL